MSETSTTPADNPNNGDAPAESTTATDPQTGTDNQPAPTGDNLDDKTKSTEPSSDDDVKSTESTSKDGAPAKEFDDDLDEWAEKRKMPKPQSDDEREAYQSLRDEQREFTRDKQAKKDADELAAAQAEAQPDEDPDDDPDPIEEVRAEIASEKKLRMQSEFYQMNSVTDEQHSIIMQVMKEKFTAPSTKEGKQRAFDLWSSVDALPDLLDIAKARIASSSESTIRDEAAQQTRDQIEKESKAKSPGQSAQGTTTSDKTENEARVERFKARYNKK